MTENQKEERLPLKQAAAEARYIKGLLPHMRVMVETRKEEAKATGDDNKLQKLENLEEKHLLNLADKKLDIFKQDDPDGYKLQIEYIDGINDVIGLIGEDRYDILSEELAHEVEKLRGDTPSSEQEISNAGKVILQLSERPSNKDINSEVWASFFKVQFNQAKLTKHAMKAIDESEVHSRIDSK